VVIDVGDRRVILLTAFTRVTLTVDDGDLCAGDLSVSLFFCFVSQ